MRPITRKVKGSRVVLMPLGCIHAPVHEKHLLDRWVAEVAADPDALALLMGDSLDGFRTHYRKHLQGYREDGNSQEAIDSWHRQEVQKLAEVLQPIRDKLLGAILGNHHAVYLSGVNSEQYLCELLQIPYLGPTGIIRIDFAQQRSFVVYAHHDGGSKGSRTDGADLNVLTRAEHAFQADVYALGHTHKCYAFKSPKIGVNPRGKPRIIEEPKVFLRTGTLLKGYKEDTPTSTKPHVPSYSELAAYRPTSLGWVKCEVLVKKGGSGNRELHFKVSY